MVFFDIRFVYEHDIDDINVILKKEESKMDILEWLGFRKHYVELKNIRSQDKTIEAMEKVGVKILWNDNHKVE